MRKTAREAELERRQLSEMAKAKIASLKLRKARTVASRHLIEDIFKVLDTYTAKGGFSSRAEALQYMKGT